MISRDVFAYNKVVFALAFAFAFIGCSDKRGFEARRIHIPGVNEKPTPKQEIPNPKVAEATPEQIQAEQVEVNNDYTKDSGAKTTIEYSEVGEEKQLNEQEVQQATTSLVDLANKTSALALEVKLLKGLSLHMVSETEAASTIEVQGLLRVQDKDYVFTSTLTIEGEKRVISDQVTWSGETLSSAKISVIANCTQKVEGKCSQFSVGLVVKVQDVEAQGYLLYFDRSENGFTLGRGSLGLVSVKQAQDGETDPAPAPDEGTPAPEAQAPEISTQTPPPEQTAPQSPESQTGVVTSGPTIPDVSVRQQDLESMKTYESNKQKALAEQKRIGLQDREADRQVVAAQKQVATAQKVSVSPRESQLRSLEQAKAKQKAEVAAPTAANDRKLELEDRKGARVQGVKMETAQQKVKVAPKNAYQLYLERKQAKAKKKSEEVAQKKRDELQDREAARQAYATK